MAQPLISEDMLQPHDVSAEESVIGSALIDSDAVGRVAGTLRSEHFYSQRNRLCYEAILHLYERALPVDMVSVAHALEDGLESVGGAKYLAELVRMVPTSFHIIHYANIVIRTAAQRRILDLIRNRAASAVLVRDGAILKESVEALSDALIEAATLPESFKQDFTWQDIGDALVAKVGQEENARLSTGFSEIDRRTRGGFSRGDLVILAADTGAGKSTLAGQWALELAKNSCQIGILSFEMAPEELRYRALAAETGIPTLAIEEVIRNPDAHDHPRLMDAIGATDDLPITVRPFTTSITGVEGWAGRLKRAGGLDMLIVDHLQLMDTDDRQTRAYGLDKIAGRLKALAMRLDCVVLGVSQVNRAALKEKTLTASAIRDSGGISNAADLIMFLREHDNPDTSNARSKYKLDLAKNRHGPQAYQWLEFQGAYSRFLPWEKDVPG